MIRRLRFLFAAALVALSATACAHGYRSAADLESAGLGPTTCTERCAELGMDMGALVLVQHSYAGCVCTPRTAGSMTAPVIDAAGAAAAGQTAIAIVQAQQQQQRQQRR
jgi:hypothetical protein